MIVICTIYKMCFIYLWKKFTYLKKLPKDYDEKESENERLLLYNNDCFVKTEEEQKKEICVFLVDKMTEFENNFFISSFSSLFLNQNVIEINNMYDYMRFFLTYIYLLLDEDEIKKIHDVLDRYGIICKDIQTPKIFKNLFYKHKKNRYYIVDSLLYKLATNNLENLVENQEKIICKLKNCL